jgi:hypothetical protein
MDRSQTTYSTRVSIYQTTILTTGCLQVLENLVMEQGGIRQYRKYKPREDAQVRKSDVVWLYKRKKQVRKM